MPIIVGYIFHQCLSLGFGVYRCGGDSHFSFSLAAFYGDSFTALLWPGPGPGGGAGTGNAGTSCRQRTADTQLPRSGPSCPGRGRPDVPGRARHQ